MIWVDGSVVTSKDDPGDFDACWDTAHVDWDVLHPALTSFEPGRFVQKARYDGEWFPAEEIADLYGTRFVDDVQSDRDTDRLKGIVVLTLGESR